MSAPDLLIDGPEDAAATAVLAHGAGAPMDSPFMAFFAEKLAGRGLRVVRFEFPYMAERRTTGKKRPPNGAKVLTATWHAVIEAMGGPAGLVIGGKSMGGRLASMVAAELEGAGNPVRGVACLGYPFHPPGKPERTRIEHLKALTTPTLIFQGARDSMGWYDEVVEYPLSPAVRLHWLEDGDHDLKPRVASGRTLTQNWTEAVERLAGFALGKG